MDSSEEKREWMDSIHKEVHKDFITEYHCGREIKDITRARCVGPYWMVVPQRIQMSGEYY
jgi:hypothetical protein